MLEEILSLALEVGLYALHATDTPATSDAPPAGGEILSNSPAYEPEEVYNLTTQIIERDPVNAQAYFLRGVVCQSMQLHDEALGDLNEAIRLEPGHARALLLRSEVLFHLGQDEAGRADRQAALRLDPSLAR
jgi:tetratricopeptide (TPR) repeat protein